MKHVMKEAEWNETMLWAYNGNMTMESLDPGMAYVIDVLTGKQETPKRIPDMDRTLTQEIPRSIHHESLPGSIESFVCPMEMELDELVLNKVMQIGPVHGEDLYWEAIFPMVNLRSGTVRNFDDFDEFMDSVIRLIDKGELVGIDDVILDLPKPRMLNMEPIRMVELFAGIGAFRKAAYNLGIPHTSVMSEINEFATMSYQAIHGRTENLGDISKVENLPECDLLTYGFPCQDISIAGNMAGFEEGSNTRSSLLWEVRRLLDRMERKPKVLIMENVKNLVSKKFFKGFEKWISYLESLGYRSSWKVINAVQVGIAQNRERVFMVSVLDGPEFRFPELPSFTDACKTTGGIGAFASHIPCPYGEDSTRNKEGIRNLTPTECFRLMGFTDRDAYRAQLVCSNSQLYRQTGNSIVVQVVEMIFRELMAQGIWEVRE